MALLASSKVGARRFPPSRVFLRRELWLRKCGNSCLKRPQLFKSVAILLWFVQALKCPANGRIRGSGRFCEITIEHGHVPWLNLLSVRANVLNLLSVRANVMRAADDKFQHRAHEFSQRLVEGRRWTAARKTVTKFDVHFDDGLEQRAFCRELPCSPIPTAALSCAGLTRRLLCGLDKVGQKHQKSSQPLRSICSRLLRSPLDADSVKVDKNVRGRDRM